MLRRTILAAGLVAATGAAPAAVSPGLGFVVRTTSSGPGAAPAGSGTRVQVLDGALRFEGEETDDGRSVVIVRPAARTLTVLMPDSKQYFEVNFADSTAQALGAVASLMAATTAVSDIQVSGSALGSGGTLNGYPTTRYRITTSYAEVSSERGARRFTLVEDLWVTGALKDVPDPMEAMTRAFGGPNGMPQMGGTMSELMRKRGDVQRRLFSGMPLKSVATSTVKDREGATTTDTSTTEIVNLQRVNLDPSDFRVPDGFERLDMKALANLGAQLRGAGRSPKASNGERGTSAMDELARAAKEEAHRTADESKQEAKDAAKDEAKGQVDGAKEKAKCALGGLFGRKKC